MENEGMELLQQVQDRIDSQYIADKVLNQIQQEINNRNSWEKKREDAWQSFMGHRDRKNKPWPNCANLNVPIVAETVLTYLPRVVNTVFGIDPVCIVRGRNKSDDSKAYLVEKFLSYLTRKVMKIFMPCVEWFLNTLVEGDGFVKVIWDKCTHKEKVIETQVIEQVDDLGNIIQVPQEIEVEKEVVDYNAPRMFVIQSTDIIRPWFDNPDIQKCDWIAQRIYTTKDDLKRKQRYGIYKNVDEVLAGYIPTQIDQKKDEIDGLQQNASENKQVVLYEWWGRYDINNDGFEEECLITVAEKTKTVLRIIQNPYKHGKRPFVQIKHIPVPNRPYGRGIPELLNPLETEINAIHNNRVDSGTLATSLTFFYNPSAGLDPRKLVIAPSVGIPRRNKDDFEFAQMQNVPASSFQEENLLNAHVQRLTNATDLSMGMQSNLMQNKTARGAMLFQGEANQRFKMDISFVQSGIEELFTQIVQLCQQYLEEDTWIQVVEGGQEEWKSFKAEDIKGDFDLMAQGNTENTNKALEREQSIFMYQTLMSNPLLSMPAMQLRNYSPMQLRSVWLATKEMLEKSGVKNADDLLPDLQELLNQILPSEQEIAQREAMVRGTQVKGGVPNDIRNPTPEMIEKMKRTPITAVMSGGNNVPA